MTEAIGGIPLKHESVTLTPTCVCKRAESALRVVRLATQSLLKAAVSLENLSFHVLKRQFC